MLGFATKKEVADLQRQINEMRTGGSLGLKDDIVTFPSEFEKLHTEPKETESYPTGSDKVSIAVRTRAAKQLRKEKKTAKEIAEILKVTPGTVRGYWKKRG